MDFFFFFSEKAHISDFLNFFQLAYIAGKSND